MINYGVKSNAMETETIGDATTLSAEPHQPAPGEPILLIGISGPNVGRRIVARCLNQRYRFKTADVSGPIRQSVRHIFSLTKEERNEEMRDSIISPWKMSPRQMSIMVEMVLEREIHQDIWLLSLKRRIQKLIAEGNTRICVSDIRKEKYAHMIRCLGGAIWHVNNHPPSPQTLTLKKPGNQTRAKLFLKRCPQDHVLVNNGTIDDLLMEVDKIMAKAGVLPRRSRAILENCDNSDAE